MKHNVLFGLNNDHLSPVFTGHFLTPAAKDAFLNMQASAAQQNIDITIASSFRSYERQTVIWNRKFSGESPVLDNQGQPIRHWETLDDLSKIQSILRWSALPGMSRHHWGTNLDVYSKKLMPENYKLQLLPVEYNEQGIFASLSHWLTQNMRAFGFYRPYESDLGGVSPEAWHLSYFHESEVYLTQISQDELVSLYREHPIKGQSTIIQNLDMIWNQYVVNINKA